MLIRVERTEDAERVRRTLATFGVWVDRVERGAGRPGATLVASSHSDLARATDLLAIPGVVDVTDAVSPHPSLDAAPRTFEVREGWSLGGRERTIVAGPCAVESEEQIDRLAARLSAMGIRWLRGGAFKPRTSPHAFQGHGASALGWLRDAARRHGMAVVTEALSETHVDDVADVADLVQVGSRNMSNFALLRAVGRTKRPALLKRAAAATVDEWLLAAEHLHTSGCPFVVFCERGVRGFDGGTRNLLDLGTVALLARVHGLPTFVDPSHGTGRRELVRPMARAGLAAGAHGLVVEVHDAPEAASSDGPQALRPAELEGVLRDLARVDGWRET
ncbi:MAG: 3-deoxy-7-phosphoheptulonate synthase [Polyangiaceae bacterium]